MHFACINSSINFRTIGLADIFFHYTMQGGVADGVDRIGCSCDYFDDSMTMPKFRKRAKGYDGVLGVIGAGAADGGRAWARLQRRMPCVSMTVEPPGGALNYTGTMSVVTAQSESFVLPEGVSSAGKVLSVKNDTRFATFFAAAVDGKKLAESSRILLMHLTDVKNSKIKFRNAAKTIEEESGGMPMLLAYGKAQLSIKSARASSLKVFGCDNSGKRMEEISCIRSGGSLSFTAETIKAGKAKYMVYELSEK